MKPTLVNWKFWSFQRKSTRFCGFNHFQVLPTNEFFFYSLENFYLSYKHIDLIIWYLKWKLKKSGSYQFIYPCDFPITKKPSEVRMGKGKGAIDQWAMPIKKGLIFFKLSLKNPTLIKVVSSFFLKKLPFKCKYYFSKHKISELSTNSFLYKNESFSLYETKLKKNDICWF